MLAAPLSFGVKPKLPETRSENVTLLPPTLKSSDADRHSAVGSVAVGGEQRVAVGVRVERAVAVVDVDLEERDLALEAAVVAWSSP